MNNEIFTNSSFLFEIIKGRRAVRNFQKREISLENLKKILEAGIWAPSGSNLQSWEFILIKDEQKKSKIKLISPGLFSNPDALIILCINKIKAQKGGRLGEEMAIMDLSMAAQNMMLIAYSLGIGSCPVASFNKIALKQILKIPEHVEPILILILGYPNKWPKPPSRKPIKEVVYHDEYGRNFE
ncbi:MAG: nitroreductase family protein [Thermoplasmata archaeon]